MLGWGLKFAAHGGVSSAFDPLSFFSAGEKGVWVEAADKSTLFQDSAGTTPVTAAGQPVGKWLDKSGRGNHFTQPTAGKRPQYVRFPAGGTRNLLTYTEDFSNAAWTDISAGVTSKTPNYGIAPDGTQTACRVVGNNDNTWLANIAESGNYASQVITDSVFAKLNSGTQLTTVQIIISVSGGSTCSKNITVTSAWTRFDITGTLLAGDTGQLRFALNIGNGNDLLIWHPQLETGSTATPYQKVVSSFDVTEAGVADVWAVKGDGVDDCMSSAAIDFTATDKMTLWAGVRKLDDTVRMVAELSSTSASNAGTMYLTAGADNILSSGHNAFARGSASPFSGQFANAVTFAGADTAALTMTHDIAGDLSTIRRNGVAGTDGTADKGAGNFGNYPLYLLSRAGTSYFFNGPISSLIVRGAATDAAGITNGEKWTAERIGATLPNFVARYAYSTPAVSSQPTAGQINHADNIPNKWNISRTDLDGKVITGDLLKNGDTMVLNGVTYTLTNEQFFDDYISLSIEPTTQQPDGTYSIAVYAS